MRRRLHFAENSCGEGGDQTRLAELSTLRENRVFSFHFHLNCEKSERELCIRVNGFTFENELRRSGNPDVNLIDVSMCNRVC